jgi:hypothetical protein
MDFGGLSTRPTASGKGMFWKARFFADPTLGDVLSKSLLASPGPFSSIPASLNVKTASCDRELG